MYFRSATCEISARKQKKKLCCRPHDAIRFIIFNPFSLISQASMKSRPTLHAHAADISPRKGIYFVDFSRNSARRVRLLTFAGFNCPATLFFLLGFVILKTQ